MHVADPLLTDTLLLQRMAAGDGVSFDTLFYRYYDRVYGVLFRLLGNRVEAEDMTQEVFLTLYQKPPRGRAQEEHNVGAWLYRVATNMGYNYIRSRQRRWQRNVLLVPGVDPSQATAWDSDPAQQVERRETAGLVRRALATLPRRQVQLLLLRQMGLSYAELAQVCQVSPTSVGTLLARAATAFRRAYDEARQVVPGQEVEADEENGRSF
ncbi:MAG: sigma-70 family RNA polymerase sigma factor [Ardenticatenales bacterium]|nr:sigma-70 family RNA polymerase sigma factor [Ardenticatenales bacterium]